MKGRLSIEWGALLRFEYSVLVSTSIKNKRIPKFRTPEAWAKGLITLNWEFVNLLWEQRIASTKTDNTHEDSRNNHYFLLQKAHHELNNHKLTNAQDKQWLLKSHEDLNKMSINQLKLWLHNMTTIHWIVAHEY